MGQVHAVSTEKNISRSRSTCYMAPSSGAVCNFEFYPLTLKLLALKENSSFTIDLLCVMPLSAICQLYHADQF